MTLSLSNSQPKLTDTSVSKFTFPTAWYAIAASHSVKTQPLGIKRLGLDLVLWRDEEGKVVCQSRHCAHRGVDLALGKIVTHQGKSCLECPYHGFQFAGDGSCVLMPCEGKKAKISKAMRLDSYKVKEAHGLIWLWWGNDDTTIPPIPWFEELEDNSHSWANEEMVWDVHFTRAAESALIDLHHFAFAHRRIAKWLGMGKVTFLDTLETEVVGDRIKSQGVLKREGEGGMEFKFKNEISFPNLSVFDFGMGGTKLFATLTPIDENKTWISFRYYVPFSLPVVSFLIAKLAVWFELNFVQPDDYRLLKSSIPKRSSLKANRFVRADRAIVEWHRLFDTPTVDRLGVSTGDSCFTDCQLAQTNLIVQTPSHHLPKHFD